LIVVGENIVMLSVSETSHWSKLEILRCAQDDKRSWELIVKKQTLNTPIHCALFKRSFAALRMAGGGDRCSTSFNV